MAAVLSLIPELEDVVQHGSDEKRAEALQQITTLFLEGASSFNDDQSGCSTMCSCRLIEEIESKARAELSRGLRR